LNKGLNRKSTYFKKEVGSSGIFAANLNKNEGGFYILLSGHETPGLSPIAFKLNFSSFNLNSTSAYGAAIRESYYYELTDDYENLKVYLKDSFGSIKEYHFVKDDNTPGITRRVFECSEDHSRIERDTYDILPDIYYNLFDKYDNKIILLKNRSYPVEIVYKSGERYTFSSRRNITNNLGTTLEISTDYRTITFKKETTEIYKIELVVENNLISKMIHKKPIISDTETTYETLYINEYIVDTTNKSITIIDGLSNYRVKFNYIEQDSTYLLVSYIESYSESFNTSNTTTITYNEDLNYTRVLSYLGEYEDYYFNESGLLSKKINSLGQIELYEYDENDYISKRITNINHTKSYNEKYAIVSEYIEDGNNFLYESNMAPTISSQNDFLYSDKVGTKALIISNYSTSSIFYIEKTYSGNEGEYLTLGLWSIKNFSYTGPTLDIKLELYLSSVLQATYEFNIHNDKWDYNSFQVKTSSKFDKVKLIFSPKSGGSYLINAVTLVPSSTVINYSYDEYGNLLNNSYMNNINLFKYSNNYLFESNKQNNTSFKLDYNEKSIPNRKSFNNGVLVDVSYNDNNQITSEIVKFNNKQMISTNTYEGGYIKTKTNQIDSTITYDINNIKGILNKVSNELNDYKEYIYDNKDYVEKIKVGRGTQSNKIEYVYNTYKKIPLIQKVKLDNNSTYEYIYDNYERIVGIDYYNRNNIPSKKRLITYTYEDRLGLPTKNIKTVNKFDSTYIENYEYDIYDNITRIYISDGTSTSDIATFTYDENKRLTKEVVGVYEKNYLYDAFNRIKEINDSNGFKFNYIYNEKNEVITKKETIDNEIVYYQYQNRSFSRSNNLDEIIKDIESSDKIYSIFFNNYDSNSNILKSLIKYDKVGNAVLLKTKDLNIVSEESVVDITTLNNIRCFDLTNLSKYGPIYNLKSEVDEYPQQSIAFWFYPTTTNNGNTLFYTIKDQSKLSNNVIKVYIENSKLKAILYQDEIKTNNVIGSTSTTSDIKLNTWQFVTISWMSRQDDPTFPDIFRLRLTLNEEFVFYQKNDPRFYITQEDNQPVFIGNDLSLTNKFIGYIGPILLCDEEYLMDSTILELFYKTRSYIVNNPFRNEAEVLTRYENNTKAAYTYPLNNSVESLTGNKPYNYIPKEGSKYDSNNGFSYNEIIKRNAFSANGSLLQFDLDTRTSGPSTLGSIRFRFYIEEDYPKQFLLEYNTRNNVRITLYRNEQKKLIYTYKIQDQDEVVINPGITISSRVWNEISFSYYSNSSSTSLVNIILNSIKYTHSTSPYIQHGGIFTIGRSQDREIISTDANDNYDPFYWSYAPLYGLIEQLMYSFNIESNVPASYKNHYDIKNYTNEFNEFGLIVKEANRYNEKDELIKEYTYKEVLDESGKSKFLPLIEKEKFIYEKKNYEINYEYDKIGRIERIIYPDTYPDSIYMPEVQYTYSFRNQLLEEYDVNADISYTYTYDANNNITNISLVEYADQGNESTLYSYSYDPKYPDRLIGVNNKTIKYDNVNQLYPVSYGLFDSSGNLTSGYTFTWNDTLLTQVTCNGSVVNYEYDQVSKLRKKKIVNNITTEYFYNDNNLLIKEISPNIEKEFIYDIDGLLKELIITKDNVKYRYIYLKDILGNIIGLLDDNLTKVATYKYRAYGEIEYEHTTVTLPFNLLDENPFKYKGYYYDKTTNMYYCHTRYYSPELCRWISPDSISYLDLESINRLNLYCYCENDPVQLIDINGNIAIVSLMLIISIVSISTLFILGIEDNNAEKKGSTFEKPKFFSSSNEEFTVFSVGGYGGRKDWYLNKNKDVSIYFSGFNLYGNMSVNYKLKDMKLKDLFKLDFSIFELGYDGRYLDFSIAGGLNNDSISIDIWQIIKDIESLFKKGEWWWKRYPN